MQQLVDYFELACVKRCCIAFPVPDLDLAGAQLYAQLLGERLQTLRCDHRPTNAGYRLPHELRGESCYAAADGVAFDEPHRAFDDNGGERFERAEPSPLRLLGRSASELETGSECIRRAKQCSVAGALGRDISTKLVEGAED